MGVGTGGWAARRADGWMDRQKDMAKLIIAFYNFVNVLKNFRDLQINVDITLVVTSLHREWS